MNSTRIGHIICESPTESRDVKIVTQNNNRVEAEGILQEAEEQNRNTRCYATKDLAREIKAPRTEELVDTGNMKGEEGHPIDKDLQRQQTIMGDRTCVKYLKFWMDGNLVKGRFKGTNNKLGEYFNADLLDGEKPSFSLRALGTIGHTGGKAWVQNLRLITYDRVYYPSHKRAYTEKIVSEVTMLKDNGLPNKTVVEENYKGQIIPITNQSVINYIKAESANIKTILNNFDTLYESITLMENGREVQLIDINHDIIIVSLENYIADEIMDYCSKQ